MSVIKSVWDRIDLWTAFSRLNKHYMMVSKDFKTQVGITSLEIELLGSFGSRPSTFAYTSTVRTVHFHSFEPYFGPVFGPLR